MKCHSIPISGVWTALKCVCVCVCVCDREGEGEGVCVCVTERERGRWRGRECVCVCVSACVVLVRLYQGSDSNTISTWFTLTMRVMEKINSQLSNSGTCHSGPQCCLDHNTVSYNHHTKGKLKKGNCTGKLKEFVHEHVSNLRPIGCNAHASTY